METELKKLVTTADEACSIIKKGAECGVATLKFRDLEVVYGVPAMTIHHDRTILPGSTGAAIPDHDKQTKESLESEEARVRIDRLEQLILEDPAEAEKQIMSGDLSDDTDGGADNDDQ